MKVLVLIISVFFYINISNSKECENNSKLKVGIIENEFIDYKYYLYYSLYNYSLINSSEFELDVVNNNIDEFDIVFGEYFQIEKLNKRSINYPSEVTDFYKKNQIPIKEENIFPLDLDTFILLKKNNIQKLNFEDLSKFYDPVKYTLGLSQIPKENFLNLFMYSLGENNLNIEKVSFDTILDLYTTSYKNINKNILENNFDTVFQSYQNNENVFTLFSDGILLYKDINYESFQLFPQSKYKWDENKGTFVDNAINIPYSFFGFSAYLNNTNKIGFLCYLLQNESRNSAFKNFNIQISPLSIHELSLDDSNLSEEYKDILKIKNKNILRPTHFEALKLYDPINKVFKKNLLNIDLRPLDDYLN